MAWVNENYNDEYKKNFTEEQDNQLLSGVENSIITLVDEKNQEFDYLILNEIECGGNKYLALAACDEKLEGGDIGDMGMDADDIVIVKVIETPLGENIIQAVSDTDELLAVSKEIDKVFGHLQAKKMSEIEEYSE